MSSRTDKRPSERVAEQRNSIDHASKRAEVVQFIDNLSNRAHALMVSCENLMEKGYGAQVLDFSEFKNLASENLTFLIIIEKRIQDLHQNDKQELQERLDDLVVAIWSIVMKGALNFLLVMSNEEHLPIGTRELFISELRTLNDAQERLSQNRYQERCSQEIHKEIKMAKKILSKIIDKAPRLLSF